MCYSFFWMVVFHRPNAVRFVQVIACQSDALLCISQENSTGRLYHSFVSPSPILVRLKIKLRIAFTHKSLRLCIYFFWMNWGERLLALMFNFIQNPQLFPRGSCDVTSPSPVLKSRWKRLYPCCVLCLDTWKVSARTILSSVAAGGIASFPVGLLYFRRCLFVLAGTFRYNNVEC